MSRFIIKLKDENASDQQAIWAVVDSTKRLLAAWDAGGSAVSPQFALLMLHRQEKDSGETGDQAESNSDRPRQPA